MVSVSVSQAHLMKCYYKIFVGRFEFIATFANTHILEEFTNELIESGSYS